MVTTALHPISDWRLIWNDAQQREHTIIAIIVVIAGVTELLRSAVPAFSYGWLPAINIIGCLFLFQAHHGTFKAVARDLRHEFRGVHLLLLNC